MDPSSSALIHTPPQGSESSGEVRIHTNWLERKICDGCFVDSAGDVSLNLPHFRYHPNVAPCALEESLGVLDPKTVRERYVTNIRAYAGELLTDKCCILGTREGEVGCG